MGKYQNKIINWLLISIVMSLSGCGARIVKNEPGYDYHYINPSKYLGTVGKLVIIELENSSNYDSVSAEITKEMYHSLQKNPLFSTKTISNKDQRWTDHNIDLYSTYSLEQLVDLRTSLNCDAVMVGIVTQYAPYPHMNMGLRLKMIDLRDGKLLWAHEQSWDCNDKAIDERIRSYFKKNRRSDYSSMEDSLLTVSPLKFMRFVAYEVTNTMMPPKPRNSGNILKRYKVDF